MHSSCFQNNEDEDYKPVLDVARALSLSNLCIPSGVFCISCMITILKYHCGKFEPMGMYYHAYYTLTGNEVWPWYSIQ
jgi:hypothetical protein